MYSNKIEGRVAKQEKKKENPFKSGLKARKEFP
jgi:hypothetical protein